MLRIPITIPREPATDIPVVARKNPMRRFQLPPVDDRELATILAALRGYQDENAPARPGGRGNDVWLDGIATDGGRLRSLGRADIGRLCQRFNHVP